MTALTRMNDTRSARSRRYFKAADFGPNNIRPIPQEESVQSQRFIDKPE